MASGNALPAGTMLRELQAQNESLRQTQLALAHSRDAYADLYNRAPVGYLTLTQDALISEVNQTGATLFGLCRDQLLAVFRNCLGISDVLLMCIVCMYTESRTTQE